jgi:GNAT superfamily N-acetyltransferase
MSQNKKKLVLRHKNETDAQWVIETLTNFWASTRVVSRGRVHDASQLPSIVAEVEDKRVGLLTYNVEMDECEIVSLLSLREKLGIGSALLDKVELIALKQACRRIWLITTNDNTHAIGFYTKRGFNLVQIHLDAITESRKLKPEIPLYSGDGVPIRDEYEFEKLLDSKDNA